MSRKTSNARYVNCGAPRSLSLEMMQKHSEISLSHERYYVGYYEVMIQTRHCKAKQLGR